MKNKEILVWKTAFPPLSKSSLKEPKIPARMVYLSITKEQVYNALIAQSIKKASGPDKINFRILGMIWK